MMAAEPDLPALLEALASMSTSPPATWEGWKITPVTGGRNNRIVRATREHHDFAIKFTLRDATDRAGREYHALRALQEHGLNFASVPLFLDTDRQPHPVVVQSWLVGESCATLPEDDAAWGTLLTRFAVVHRIGPDITAISLPNAVFDAHNSDDVRQRMEAILTRLPPTKVPDEVRDLIRRIDETMLPQWKPPRLGLVHGDPNVRNFIRQSDGWTFVDWEYSGWGDPAFEIANLVAHPGNIPIPLPRWEWVAVRYAEMSGDAEAHTRVHTYCLMLAVAFAAYFANLAYQFDEGEGERERLVPQSPSRRTEIASHYRHYLTMATALLDAW